MFLRSVGPAWGSSSPPHPCWNKTASRSKQGRKTEGVPADVWSLVVCFGWVFQSGDALVQSTFSDGLYLVSGCLRSSDHCHCVSLRAFTPCVFAEEMMKDDRQPSKHSWGLASTPNATYICKLDVKRLTHAGIVFLNSWATLVDPQQPLGLLSHSLRQRIYDLCLAFLERLMWLEVFK